MVRSRCFGEEYISADEEEETKEIWQGIVLSLKKTRVELNTLKWLNKRKLKTIPVAWVADEADRTNCPVHFFF